MFSWETEGAADGSWRALLLYSAASLQLSSPCSWTTSGLKSQGRLSVGSNRDREISMSVGLGRSKLDSKGGVVGGNIDVNTLEMVCEYNCFRVPE